MAKTAKKPEEPFEDFNTSTSASDFFGVTDAQDLTDPLTILEEAKKADLESGEEEEEENASLKKKEEEEEDVKFFESEEEDEEEEEEEEEDPNKKKESPVSKSTSTLNFLKEKGLIEFELEEGQELDDESAESLIEEKWEESVEKAAEEFVKELPQEIKNLIKYSAKGGNPYEYLKTLYSNRAGKVHKDMDPEAETTHIAAIEEDLQGQGYDEEYIQAQIEFLKDSKKLETIGKKAFDKIIKAKENLEQQEIERVAKTKQDRKKNIQILKKDVQTFLSEQKEVGGFTITKEDLQVLPQYIAEPSVELEDGREISQLQADIFKAMADKNKLIMLSKILKTDFDFSSLKKKAVTENVRKKRENLQGQERAAAPRQKNKKSLWDLIDD